MTKSDLTEAVYRVHGGLSRREAAEIVEGILAAMKGSILQGSRVQISGFGCFEVVKRRSRRGRNPQTGEVIAIGSRRRLVFRPSKTLVENLN